jgi:hypothetical protein
MDNLKNTLPKSEYDKLNKLYKFCYNSFLFIYNVDTTLVNQFNFIINYIIHKEIEKNIMHNEICLGRTEVLFVNELDIFYINMAGNNLILEDILIKNRVLHNPLKKKTYSIVQTFDLELKEYEDIFDKMFKKAGIEYIKNVLKIIFYLEILNKNDISKDIIRDIKKRVMNYQLKNYQEIDNYTEDNKEK